MTATKISALTDGGSLQPGDRLPIARDGANFYIDGGLIGGSTSYLDLSDRPTIPTKTSDLINDSGFGTGGGTGGTGGTGGSSAHKAWRLRIDATTSNTYCSLGHLEFRETAGTSTTASGGTAFSTATGNGALPGYAFAGTSRWVAEYPNSPYPKYVGYIYADPISVAQYAISSATNYASEAPTSGRLEYSDDTTDGFDGTWVAMGPFTVNDWTNSSSTRTFAAEPPPASAHRYWRIKLSGNHSGSNTTIGKIKFRSTPGGADLPVTLSRYSSQTSTSEPASAAFDYTTSTPWGTATGDFTPYIDLDLGSALTVAELVFSSRSDSPYTLTATQADVYYFTDSSLITAIYVATIHLAPLAATAGATVTAALPS